MNETLVNALDVAVDNAPWLTPADSAMILAARMMAQELESNGMTASGLREFHRVLESLGLTLAGRVGKVDPDAGETDVLEEFRADAGGER